MLEQRREKPAPRRAYVRFSYLARGWNVQNSSLNHYTADHLHQLTDTLQRYADAGIDPAFDMEMEELERQYAELRLTFSSNN